MSPLLLSQYPLRVGKVAADQCGCRLCGTGEESVEHWFVCPFLAEPCARFKAGVVDVLDYIRKVDTFPIAWWVQYLLCAVDVCNIKHLRSLVDLSCAFIKSCSILYNRGRA